MAIHLFEVGGSIRDELMDLPNSDRDFCAVSTKGWDSLLSWADKKMKVFKVVPEFLTIRGSLGPDVIDIVMCRKDSNESDGRRPNSVEPGTLFDDLSRRDFTMNAMAREVDKKTLEPIGDIIDPFNGAGDISRSLIRSVGDAQKRFDEDNLRLIRAVRFSLTKNLRLDLDVDDIVHSSFNWQSMMLNVSKERIREELHKMFTFNTALSIQMLASIAKGRAVEQLFSEDLWIKPTLERKR